MQIRTPTCRLLAAAAILSLAACGGGGGDNDDQAQQETITSTAALDGTMTFNNVGSVDNGNASSSPQVGDGVFMASGETLMYQGLWSFDLSAIPSGATITSATLRLVQIGTANDPTGALAQGVVDHVNFGATFPSTIGAVNVLTANVGTIADLNTQNAKTVDVASEVQADLDASRARSQFRVRGAVGTDNDAEADFAVFSEAEHATAAERPMLIVEFLP